jgi:hypothetical protein
MTASARPAWHIPSDDLERYERGELSSSGSASVEAHLLACPECRDRVATAVPAEVLDRMWNATVDRVDAPRLSWFERLAVVVGVPPALARLAALTPAVRASYLLAVTLVSAVAVFASYSKVGPVAFLVAAPLVCVAGVAAAYAATNRAVRELETSTSFGGLRLLLLRTTTVVGSSIVICSIASMFLPELSLEVGAWLLPALALTSTSLALGTRTDPLRSTAIVGLAWILLVGLTLAQVPHSLQPTGDSLGPMAVPLQLAAGVLFLASTAVFTIRRQTVDLPTA